MENKFKTHGSPYDKPPTRLKCVAVVSRPVATKFIFGESVGAIWSTVHKCALTDGRHVVVLTLPDGKESKIVENQTYVFRNLVIREARAFYNDNTTSFKSYEMAVGVDIVERAKSLLTPPSQNLSLENAGTAGLHTYVTLEGQVVAIAEIRKVELRGSPIPLRETKLSHGGVDVGVTLWREAALQDITEGQWLRFSHLKLNSNQSFGQKYNTTTYTTVTQINAAPVAFKALIVGAELWEDYGTLVLDTGRLLKVPAAAWRGTEGQFLKRLPLQATLQVEGDWVTSPNVLFEDEDSNMEGENLEGEDLKGEEGEEGEDVDLKGEEGEDLDLKGEEGEDLDLEGEEGEDSEGLDGVETLLA
ncbi:uncharacterized protein LOC143102037 [Alosa pseudoharengus]|uniref:uncharacterized protein LOC143102037 n=1 Tax=Alosa pseudoharengus TaxID=34774 RepID=UPI003F8BFBA2